MSGAGGRLAALVALVAGCSSSTPAAGGAATDGGGTAPDGASPAADAGADAAPVQSDQCGAAPYVTLGITVTGFTAGAAVAGARFTSSLCPGVYDLTDASGRLTGHVTQGAAFYGRFEASGYVSILTPEQRYAADDDAIGVQMLPALFTALVPGYDAAKATLFVAAQADNGHDGGSDPCDQLDGVSFSIDGHPEWTPTYYAPGSVPQPTTGAATTSAGRASFAGVDPGEPLVVRGTKPGCSVGFAHAANTGRSPREAGYLTLVPAYLHDVPADAGAD